MEPPHYDYPVKGGEEVLERLGLLLHFPARQARGYRGAGARLMAALYSYCSRFLRSNGYEDVFLPPFREGSPLLIVSADRIFPSWELPAKSFCFSPAGVEHGAPEKDQALPTFQALCCVEEQDQTREYAALLYCVRKLFEELSLSGRVRRPALPQMADEMAQECQLELWLPSSAHYLSAARIGDAGDYLARRHKMRVRGGNKEIRFVHTVHLTINLERLLLALAEQKQSDDGSIHLPPPLWDLMGDSRINGF